MPPRPLSEAPPGSATPPSPRLMEYTFLLISAGDFPLFSATHSVVGRSEGFSRLGLDWGALPPLQITLRQAVLTLVRNTDASSCRTAAG